MSQARIKLCIGLGIFAVFSLMLSGGSMLAIQKVKTPANAVGPAEAMAVKSGEYVTIKGTPEATAATIGLSGHRAVLTFEGERRLIVHLPEKHKLVEAIHDENEAEVFRQWEITGKVKVGKENDVPFMVMNGFLKDLELDERDIHVVDASMNPVVEKRLAYVMAFVSFLAFLGLSSFIGLLIWGAYKGGGPDQPPAGQYGQYPQQFPPGQYPQQQYPQQPGQYPQQPGQYPQLPGQFPQQQYPQQPEQHPPQ